MKKKPHKNRQKNDTAESPQNPLSEKQSEVLRCIEETLSLSGRPPTYREIAQSMGDLAVGTVQDHVRALERKGYLLKDKTTKESSRNIARSFRLAHQAQALSIPILGTVPAGRPIEAIEDQRGSLTVPARCTGEIFALQVRGESMKDAGILDGDYVIIRKQQEAQDGEIVVAMIDGEATVKTLERREGRVRLLPANSAFKPIELESGHENLIQGKVIGVQRYL